MKLTTDNELTPELIAESGAYTKAEKLERLEEMRRKLIARRASGGIGDSDQEERIADIDRAMNAVKRKHETGREAFGRMPSA